MMSEIVHDPGHGGLDPGGVYENLQEKRLTWTIANKVIWYLNTQYKCKNHLIQPSMYNPKSTGDDEIYKVVEEANNLHDKSPISLFVSYHINAGGGTGFESFIARNASQQSQNYQNAIHPMIADYFKKHGSPDRGKKVAGFYVVTKTKMPALLLELGFIDNPKDRALLTNDLFIEGLSKTIADAIAKALKLPELKIPMPDEKDYKKLYQEQLELVRKYEQESREMRQTLASICQMTAKYMID